MYPFIILETGSQDQVAPSLTASAEGSQINEHREEARWQP